MTRLVHWDAHGWFAMVRRTRRAIRRLGGCPCCTCLKARAA